MSHENVIVCREPEKWVKDYALGTQNGQWRGFKGKNPKSTGKGVPGLRGSSRSVTLCPEAGLGHRQMYSPVHRAGPVHLLGTLQVPPWGQS